MQNSHYNLMTQLVQEQKSLWRIKNHYLDEAANEEEKSFWQNMLADKQKHVDTLQKMISSEN